MPAESKKSRPKENETVLAVQAEALSELHWLYSQAALWGKPRRFEYVTFAKDDDGGLGQLLSEAMHADLEAMRRIETAKRRLLASGFPVPDSWLTVRAYGTMARKWEILEPQAGQKKPQYRVTLTDTGADVEGLRKVCKEMYVTMLRLEEQGAGRGEPPPPAEPKDGGEALKGFLPLGACLTALRVRADRRSAAGKALQRARAKAPADDDLFKWDSDFGQRGRALYNVERAARILAAYR